MAIGFIPRSFPPDAPEHVLWVRRKDTRQVRAVMRGYSHGLELRLIYKGELLWSRLFAPGEYAELEATAEDTLHHWEALGWEPAVL
jgi:hypothetical protein